MATPLTQWICDTCGEPVGIDEAYVVWDARGQPRGGYKIIHRKRCDDKSLYMASSELKRFLGPDGAAYLTSMLSDGYVRVVGGEAPVRQERLPDLDSWVDFFRRVQIPYYEEARPRLATEAVRERFADASESYPYMQSILQDVAGEG